MLNHDKKYKVKKTELLSRLRQNRTKHVETYEEAKRAHRSQLIQAMRDVITADESGNIVPMMPVRKLLLSPPRQHIKDYDQVIGLLEFTTEEVVEINPTDFRTYVMDEWGWRSEFEASTQNYLNAAAGPVDVEEVDEHDKW